MRNIMGGIKLVNKIHNHHHNRFALEVEVANASPNGNHWRWSTRMKIACWTWLTRLESQPSRNDSDFGVEGGFGLGLEGPREQELLVIVLAHIRNYIFTS